MTPAQILAKLVEALGHLAMPVILLLAIANIVAVTGSVGAALFADAESAARHLFDLQIMIRHLFDLQIMIRHLFEFQFMR